MVRWMVWGLLVLIATRAYAQTTVLPGLIRESISFPITLADGSATSLEGLVIRPDRPGRLPLVVLVHGTPRSKPEDFQETFRKVSPTVLGRAALAFAQHGYAAVSILRRGFGHSEGPYAEYLDGPCATRDYLKAALISAEDVNGALSHLRGESWADPERIVLLGQSTGGVAVIAAGSSNPAGVVGILNFAGGRGSPRPDYVCGAERLVDAFAHLGASGHIPSLWLYTENDHFFSPDLGRRMFSAYSEAGAPAAFELLPPFGADGHLLVSVGPADAWWTPVENFLAALHLPTVLEVVLPPLPPLPAPALTKVCVSLFDDYVAARTDAKAFAVNPEGHCAFTTRSRTRDEARDEALEACAKRWPDCSVYAIGQDVVEVPR